MEDPGVPPSPHDTESATTPPPTHKPLPWEDPSTGTVDGLLRTFGMFVTRPQKSFRAIKGEGIGRPFVYALVLAYVEFLAITLMWVVLEIPLMAVGIEELENRLAGFAVGASVMVAIIVSLLVLLPAFVAIGIAIHACILHLAVLIVGEGKAGFEGTIRLICYSHTADVAALVPFCGGFLSLVWFAVLQIIGVAEVHRCSYGKASLAVLLPMLFCCACTVVGIATFGAAIIAAAGGN